ncbi:beta-ketoacyl-[acyl-carrier-protein] synthase family protein [Streptomyces sp. NPDC041068]|uniref:beta-ketoacyl-[acyl-carrier-protein] synthase family protein n=1 Tax=Streptomyces sp. NPDC041068 TaxID=3155130 RepID=UPI0033EEC159
MTGHERRVVVTGLGLVTGLGEGAAESWKALLAGQSAIGPLRAYDPEPLQTRLGVEIDGFDPSRWASRRTLKAVTRSEELAMAGASLALADAGIDAEAGLGDRTGLFLGSNKEAPETAGMIRSLNDVRKPDGSADLPEIGRRAQTLIHPLLYVVGLQPAAGFYISERYGIRGPNNFFAGTAEAGAVAIGRAARAVRRGEAELALAGGFDDATSWWSMAKLDVVGQLTTDNQRGAEAVRPFDRDRSGYVLGEGAALLVLEEREHARARGARIYAELTGFGSGNERVRPHGTTEDGAGLARAIRRALRDADNGPGGAPAGVDYVAAHGDATPSGDISETRALRGALGTAADTLQASSVKPQTGHLVGGAGALNAAVAALALDSGVVPATCHLTDPDPACDLDYVPGEPRETRPESALALARGLDGQAVALSLSRA